MVRFTRTIHDSVLRTLLLDSDPFSLSSIRHGPHKGSATTAYGVYNIASLADYEIYRQNWRTIRKVARTIALRNKTGLS
jgi:hypothetical protein